MLRLLFKEGNRAQAINSRWAIKTKFHLVIDNDREMVEKRIQQISKVIPEEQVGELLIHGTPEDVLKQIELLEEVRIQYLIVDLEPNRDLEALEIFGDSIIKKTSRTAKAAH